MEDKKRVRDTESDSVESSKRIRDDSLADSDPVPMSHDDLDVDSFMPESSASPAPVSGESNPYLAHLLEASDDELGLPPRGVSTKPDATWADELNQLNEVSCDSFELKDRAGSNADVYVGDSLDYPSRFYFADSVDFCDMPYRFEPLSESSDSEDGLIIILNDPSNSNQGQ